MQEDAITRLEKDKLDSYINILIEDERDRNRQRVSEIMAFATRHLRQILKDYGYPEWLPPEILQKYQELVEGDEGSEHDDQGDATE